MTNKTLKLITESTTPSTQHDNPFLEAAAEAGGGFQKILKFNKGDWPIGSGDDKVAEGTQYVAHIDQTARGWIKFEDGKVTDRRIVKIIDGKPPSRKELGDNDRDQWERDDSGKPRDPWVKRWYLPLTPVDAQGDLTVFASGTKGGIGAIGTLLDVYGRSERNGLLPIIALKCGSYKHPQYGKVLVPEFPIVSWHGVASPPQAPPDDGAPWDDEIPY